MLALASIAAVIIWGAVWFIGNARKLMVGEPATVRSVTRCVEGGGQVLPPSHCDGSWVFSDGRTGAGEIITGKGGVSAGDTIFAGDTWAYWESAPLHQMVWIPSGVLCVAVVIAVPIWVNHRRKKRASVRAS
ncbi:hypothetical protein [Streptomyces sp. NPDC018693]|uniref:hypothetical protein n=1 Tax=unclassified Streptomyces TaxID=2593676 RepID=UPI0037BC1FD9